MTICNNKNDYLHFNELKLGDIFKGADGDIYIKTSLEDRLNAIPLITPCLVYFSQNEMVEMIPYEIKV